MPALVKLWQEKVKKSSGFTLLEILLALTLISGAGFVLAVKLPLHLQTQRLNQASTLLLEDLRDTRQAALAENTWYEVHFYNQEACYRIFKQGILVRKISLAQGIAFANSNPDLTFNASGTPSLGMTIILQNANGETKRVIVAAVSGRIREE